MTPVYTSLVLKSKHHFRGDGTTRSVRGTIKPPFNTQGVRSNRNDSNCKMHRYSLYACPQTRIPTQQCDEHHHIFVDSKGFRSTPACTNEPLTSKSVWVPSMEFQRWSKLPVSLPPLASDCSGKATLDSALLIDSPKPNHRILLLDDGSKQSIPLEAIHNDPHAKLYWYIDNEFIGSSEGTTRIWWTPTEGAHVIAAEDAHGNSDLITVQVDRFSNVKTD